MAQPVVTGALLQCSFGTTPGSLNVLPIARVQVEGRAPATIPDAAPFVNIPSFGQCLSLANPMVAAATSAALGVLTPMPCVPVTTSWIPVGPPTVMFGNKPAINNNAMCACNWGGVIKINMPGPVRTTIP